MKTLQTAMALTAAALIGTAQAATFTVVNANADGAGSLSQAIRDADASGDPTVTILFNIPGAGPHYIPPPVNGFPLITKDGLTIDGYSQPGASPNTAPITANNNAVIKIVLDARVPNNNFRDMAYVGYGSVSISDPPINNATMYGDGSGTATGRDRGGYDPSSWSPYVPGEVAILGVYRAQDVQLRGVALLGDNSGTEYAIAVAQDYGLDAAVKDRWTYDNGTCRGFHLSGCWIGTDPGTGLKHLSGAALAAFRHRDKSGASPSRPELPNMENMVLGVKNGAGDARAQFNVLEAITGGLTIAAEGTRCKVAGNQFLGSGAPPEIGRYDDTVNPSLVYGTDGDAVNDAEEGNLIPETSVDFYNTGNKLFKFAGNVFGLARDGSRPAVGDYAVDAFGFNQRSRVTFGANMDGVNDDLEANTLYDTLGLAVNAAAPDNTPWVSLRRNRLIKNLTLPTDEATGLSLYDKYITAPFTPAITAVTTSSLTGTCGAPVAGVGDIAIDVYLSDPEGDTAGYPQGRVFLGSFLDNSPADSNPAVGAFTLNTSGLGIHSGDKVTINATYLKTIPSTTITSVSRSAGITTLTIAGPGGPYNIYQSSVVTGPYTLIATVAGSPAVFADASAVSFYKASFATSVNAGQSTPFATSATVP